MKLANNRPTIKKLARAFHWRKCLIVSLLFSLVPLWLCYQYNKRREYYKNPPNTEEFKHKRIGGSSFALLQPKYAITRDSFLSRSLVQFPDYPKRMHAYSSKVYFQRLHEVVGGMAGRPMYLSRHLKADK